MCLIAGRCCKRITADSESCNARHCSRLGSCWAPGLCFWTRRLVAILLPCAAVTEVCSVPARAGSDKDATVLTLINIDLCAVVQDVQITVLWPQTHVDTLRSSSRALLCRKNAVSTLCAAGLARTSQLSMVKACPLIDLRHACTIGTHKCEWS